VRLVRVEIVVGRVPVKRLIFNDKVDNFVKPPSEEGTTPRIKTKIKN
jgi:hypothetical protein